MGNYQSNFSAIVVDAVGVVGVALAATRRYCWNCDVPVAGVINS